jgi:HMW1C N-terminal/HMW1 domain 2
MTFSLASFESHVCQKRYELAGREFLALLNDLDANYGNIDSSIFANPLRCLTPQEIDAHFLARICGAISTLLTDPDFHFSPEWERRVFELQRWISTLFAASPFRNTDHILQAMNIADTNEISNVLVKTESLRKFCALYIAESEIDISFDRLWEVNRTLAAGLFLALMSPRFLATRAAHKKREQLLEWLPEKLLEIDDLFDLPFGILHDVYMHCSYADYQGKHEIKRSINSLIRRKLIQEGFVDLGQTEFKAQKDKKPVVLVVMEWFTNAHSVYRTHSASLRELKRKFYVIGMGFDNTVDEDGRAVFDDFVIIPKEIPILDQVRHVYELAEKISPHIFYCPAVGMFPLTIFLSNLRFAKYQIVALGHGASTMATCMDYYVLDEDFIGDPNCFSETLIRMPKDGMPFVPSSAQINLEPVLRPNPSIVKVAVASTLMKFNPRFLQACQQIAIQSKVPIEFHFLPGMAIGLGYLQLKILVGRYMPNAIVHQHLPFAEYMKTLNECDLYINPFPYGNMNGIADMARQGLVGVCRTGPDVHEHIDQGMFERLGLPDWLIASSDEDYIKATLRLIEDHKGRLALRQDLLARKAVDVFYKGRPEVLGQFLYSMLTQKKEGGSDD